jgi:Xaa-Pro aminopeptidase
MSRIEALLGALQARGADGMLVCGLKNVRYLSGFTGSSACLLITRNERLFFTDFRYKEQAAKETRGYEIFIEKEERPRLILRKAKAVGIRTLGFETSVSYAFYRTLLKKGFRLKGISNLVEDMRRVKDGEELALLKEAIARAEGAFLRAKPYIREGVTERAIAARIEDNLKKSGCGSLPFDIIVASGPNSSMPHASPTDRKIAAGDLVVVDWGGEAGGYFSDMTRTVLVAGRDVAAKKGIYSIVLDANLTAVKAVKEGAHARAIDRAARDFIRKAGYGEFFGHGTGHGVGLDVHELPRISRLGRERVKAGMVFTIEPGIYVPGVGGVRIEDMVEVTTEGCNVLTNLPRGLEILH